MTKNIQANSRPFMKCLELGDMMMIHHICYIESCLLLICMCCVDRIMVQGVSTV